MPIYDFKCDNCGTISEELVSLTTVVTLEKECLVCNSKATMRKIDSFTKSKPVLRGAGFYETDYKHNMKE